MLDLVVLSLGGVRGLEGRKETGGERSVWFGRFLCEGDNKGVDSVCLLIVVVRAKQVGAGVCDTAYACVADCPYDHTKRNMHVRH